VLAGKPLEDLDGRICGERARDAVLSRGMPGQPQLFALHNFVK